LRQHTDDVSGITSIGGGATLSGYFTYDTDTDIPLGGTINVAGGAYAGTYSVAPSSNDSDVAAFGNGIYELFLAFNSVFSAAPDGAVAGVVGIEGGVVSEVINLESSGVEAPDRRPRHEQHYHEDRFLAA
jgi:hypothetical protein